MKHAKFSPSAAHRWMNCPGSWGLEQEAPKGPPNEAAMIGTVVHAMIEWVLNSEHETKSFLGDFGVCDDKGAFVGFQKNPTYNPSNSFEITEKMVQDAQICIDLVNGILERRPNAQLYLESKLEIVPEHCYGYADIIIHDEDWLCVIDYKNGVNHVEVDYNPQLMLYGLGALNKLDLRRTVGEVTVCVVQPNDRDDSKPVRTWKFIDIDIFEHHTEDYIQQCKIAYAGDPSDTQHYCIGSWCQWCKGANRCPLQKQTLLKAAQVELPDLPDYNTTPLTPTPAAEMSNAQLGWLLVNGPIVQNLIKLAGAEALRRAKAGEVVPGTKLVMSRTHRKISEEAGLAEAAETEGWDIYDKKLKGLTNLDKEVPKNQLKKYVEKPDGYLVLVPESDKRKGVKLLNEVDSLPELE